MSHPEAYYQALAKLREIPHKYRQLPPNSPGTSIHIWHTPTQFAVAQYTWWRGGDGNIYGAKERHNYCKTLELAIQRAEVWELMAEIKRINALPEGEIFVSPEAELEAVLRESAL